MEIGTLPLTKLHSNQSVTSRIDDIPRCLECGMIVTLLANDDPTNLRVYCKECPFVWLLPANYFEPLVTLRRDG